MKRSISHDHEALIDLALVAAGRNLVATGQLEVALHRARLSQSDLARQLGVTPGAVNRWVTTARLPSARLAKELGRLRLAAGLGVDVGVPVTAVADSHAACSTYKELRDRVVELEAENEKLCRLVKAYRQQSLRVGAYYEAVGPKSE